MSNIQYTPIPILEVCSNKIIGGGYLLGIDGYPPLTIGKGTVPIIWLHTPTKKGWSLVVDENKSKRKEIAVIQFEEPRRIEIYYNSNLMIRAEMSNEDHCIVDHLDFRQIGLLIYGDSKSLTVAEKNFSQNTFQSVKFMIGIKSNPKTKDLGW
jgi:hypothetical protein